MPSQKNKSKKKKRKDSLLKRFFKVLFTILSIYFVGLFAFVGYVIYIYDGDTVNIPIVDNIVSVVAPKVPEVTNVLLVGLDNEETRTDTIILASYNSVSGKLSIASIPRDTLVTIPSSRWQVMIKNYPALSGNTSRGIKINEIHSYAKEEGMDFLKAQVEEMFGININYYVKVNLEGFRYIVDSIGGVEFDVPQRMYYSDPTQNLYINLQPGLQILDGDKAEQLVRFRRYTMADLQRVQVQQDFIKVLLQTILDTENIISNPIAYLTTIINYVETDFKLSDAVKYISLLKDFNISNFNSYTLSGTAQYINGVSYYVVEDYEILEFLEEFFADDSEEEDENLILEESFGKAIQVLNGSYTSKVAAKTKDILEDAGYNVQEIGDYDGDKRTYTRIYVSKNGQGYDLKEYFSEPKIIVDSEFVKKSGYDIVIIIGIEEKF